MQSFSSHSRARWAIWPCLQALTCYQSSIKGQRITRWHDATMFEQPCEGMVCCHPACGTHCMYLSAQGKSLPTVPHRCLLLYCQGLLITLLQGHPAALVSARGASSGLSAIINSAMRSFLNEPTAADDIPALLSWWQDACQSAAGPAAAAEEHGGKAQTAATCTAMESGAATPQRGSTAIESGTATPQRGRQAAPAAATPARQLRARTPAKTPGKPGNAKQSSSGVQQLGPPVLILQDADSSDMETLEELVVALSEVWSCICID
eukprot:GHUV01029429.1.p1 GENE.GHUV01029429.1~~GHUV01029429.1.p1  ORF type:complete len:264 (+),score=82.95 GHUV01029429.1:661-1452(+)